MNNVAYVNSESSPSSAADAGRNPSDGTDEAAPHDTKSKKSSNFKKFVADSVARGGKFVDNIKGRADDKHLNEEEQSHSSSEVRKPADKAGDRNKSRLQRMHKRRDNYDVQDKESAVRNDNGKMSVLR